MLDLLALRRLPIHPLQLKAQKWLADACSECKRNEQERCNPVFCLSVVASFLHTKKLFVICPSRGVFIPAFCPRPFCQDFEMEFNQFNRVQLQARVDS